MGIEDKPTSDKPVEVLLGERHVVTDEATVIIRVSVVLPLPGDLVGEAKALALWAMARHGLMSEQEAAELGAEFFPQV